MGDISPLLVYVACHTVLNDFDVVQALLCAINSIIVSSNFVSSN